MPMYNKMIINPFFKCTHFKIPLLFRKLEMLRKFMYTSTQFRDMKHFTEEKQTHWGSSTPEMQGSSRKKKYFSKTSNFI